jgi:hypothetical protein
VTFQQGITWLETGVAPPRDLFWLSAPTDCAATGGVTTTFIEGKDLCREDVRDFTDLVGRNRIVNWLFDLHLALLAIGAYVMFVLTLLVIVIAKRGHY